MQLSNTVLFETISYSNCSQIQLSKIWYRFLTLIFLFVVYIEILPLAAIYETDRHIYLVSSFLTSLIGDF